MPFLLYGPVYQGGLKYDSMAKHMRAIIAFLLIVQLVFPYPLYAATVGKFTAVVGMLS